MEDVQKAFEVLLEKNLISYNAIVDGYVKNTSFDEAIKMFNKFEEIQSGVDSFTFSIFLSAEASLGAARKGDELHAYLLKSSFDSNQRAINNLKNVDSTDLLLILHPILNMLLHLIDSGGETLQVAAFRVVVNILTRV